MTFSVPPELLSDLAQVEQIIRARTHARSAIITMVDPDLIAPAADRLRALLVLAIARLGHSAGEQVVHAAAAVELIEAATRTHDHLIDVQARRFARARDGSWDHGVALMVGDYLFALAAGEMARSPDARVIGIYSQAVMRICEGQLTTIPALTPLAAALDAYWQRAEALAGALLSAAAQAGVLCGRLPEQLLDVAGRYGLHLGLALHLAREIRDLSDQGQLLQAGQTPLALLLAAGDQPAPELQAVFAEPSPAAIAAALPLIRAKGMPAAQAVLAEHQTLARHALHQLPTGVLTGWLERLIDQIDA